MAAAEREPRPVGRWSLIGACAAVVLLVVGMELRGDHDTHRPAASPEQPPRGAEARLAAMQPVLAVGGRAVATERVSSLLDILAAECADDARDALAAMTIRSVRELRAAGIETTPTDVLGGVLGGEDGGTLRCRALFDHYVELQRSGQDP